MEDFWRWTESPSLFVRVEVLNYWWYNFAWILSDIDTDKLNGRRKEIVKDFVKQIDNEIETSFRNGLRK